MAQNLYVDVWYEVRVVHPANVLLNWPTPALSGQLERSVTAQCAAARVDLHQNSNR